MLFCQIIYREINLEVNQSCVKSQRTPRCFFDNRLPLSVCLLFGAPLGPGPRLSASFSAWDVLVWSTNPTLLHGMWSNIALVVHDTYHTTRLTVVHLQLCTIRISVSSESFILQDSGRCRFCGIKHFFFGVICFTFFF